MDILTFQDEHRFLSNFYPSPIVVDGKRYPTVEHAFQAAKTNNDKDKEMIRQAASPGLAKKFGREVRLRPDWEKVKDSVMKNLLELKFQIPELRAKLLATGKVRLVEGNTWGDTYWGVCRGEGLNTLGYFLMDIRAGIRE